VSYAFYVAVGALFWTAMYLAVRAPRRGFDQFRESPFFDPHSRGVAAIWATVAATLAVSFCEYTAP